MFKQSTTLIIHPEDRTTDFLKLIYRNIPNKTLITGGITKADLRDLIVSHDKIMMMGHGSAYGLTNVGGFYSTDRRIVDLSMVEILKEKTDSLFIWCYADQFVEYNQLTGFYTGMFVSEMDEAQYCGFLKTSQTVIDESNRTFGMIMSEHIMECTETLYQNVKKEYGRIAKTNRIADYNHRRLYDTAHQNIEVFDGE